MPILTEATRGASQWDLNDKCENQETLPLDILHHHKHSKWWVAMPLGMRRRRSMLNILRGRILPCNCLWAVLYSEMEKMGKTRRLRIIFRCYQICHIIFNLCWIFRLVTEKVVYWSWWGIPGIFFLLLVWDKKLKENIDDSRSKVEDVIAFLWIISCWASSFLHSPML